MSWLAGIEIELFTAALPGGAVALAEEMPLGATQHVAFGPEFDRKIRRAEVVARRIGHRHKIVDAIEGEGLPIVGLPGDPGRPIDQRAGVPGPRGIGQRRAASFVHAIGRHEIGHDRGGDRGRPIRLNLGERQDTAVDPDFIEQPAERIRALEVADHHDVGRAVGFQGLGGRGDQRAIHIDLERIGAVRERHGDMVPVRIGDRAGDSIAGGEGAKRELVAGIEIELFTAALPGGAVALAEEMPLGAAQHIAFGPEFDRKIRRAEVVARRIGDRHKIVDAIEGEGLPIVGLAGDPGGPIDQRAGVPGPRGIGQRGPAPFVHPIGGHQIGHDRGRGRGGVRVIQTQIAGAIDRADAIAVAGAGREARIAIAVRTRAWRSAQRCCSPPPDSAPRGSRPSRSRRCRWRRSRPE